MTTYLRSFLFGLIFLAGANAHAQLYLSPSGSDTNPGTQAQPKGTLQGALSAIPVGGTDVIRVAAGTYVGTANIALRTFTLEPADPNGPRPVFTQNTGTQNQQALLAIDGCPNSTIRGIQLDVDQSYLVNGITTIGNCTNFRVDNVIIRAVGSIPGRRAGSATNPTQALAIDGSNVTTFPSVVIEGLQIAPTLGTTTANTWYFDRGLLLRGVQGRVGGPNAAQACTFKAARDILTQFLAGGSMRVENNTFNGGGIDVTLPQSTATVQLVGNRFEPQSTAAWLLPNLIFLKQNTNGARIEVDNNLISGYSNTGLLSAGSANVFVRGNQFLPNDTTRNNFTSLEVNTRWEGTTQTPAVANSITITGNTFGAARGTAKGTGILFKNERRPVADASFGALTVGGASAAEANTFGENLARFIKLDNQRLRTVNVTLDVSGNLYTIGGSALSPAGMTNADLFRLEDKLDHGIDDDSTGLLRVRPSELYITPRSFTAPQTTQPSIQRAVFFSQAGDIVNIKDSLYPLPVVVNKGLTFRPSGTATVIGDLAIQTPGPTDQLLIDNTMATRGVLTLTSGRILLQNSNLKVLAPSATNPPTGSDASYVITNGTGKLMLVGLATEDRNFPIGTLDAYRPVIMANAGTADTASLRIQAQVLSQGFTGTPVDTVVDFTWFFTEGTPGAGNYTFRPQWRTVDERPDFFRDRGFLQRWNATTASWEFLTGPRPPNYLPIAGADPYVATATGLNQTFSFDTPLRIYAPLEIPDTVFYVDGIDGQDNFPTRSGRTAEFAWRTLQYAVTNSRRVAPSRFIWIKVRSVAQPYNQPVTIPADKGRMVIRGGFGGADPAPTLTNATGSDPILTVSADTVLLEKLGLELSGAGTTTGLRGQTNYNLLSLDSCIISVSQASPNTSGIVLEATSQPQRIGLTASTIGTAATPLATGLAATNVFGQIGGTGGRGNTFNAATSIVITGANGGTLSARNNTINSTRRGITVRGGNGSVVVAQNRINPAGTAAGTGIWVAGLTDNGISLTLDSNRLAADTGIVLANNRQAIVSSNQISVNRIGTYAGSGLSGTTFPASVAGSLQFTGNTIGAAAGSALVGIVLGHEGRSAGVTPAFSQVTIGNPSALNTFDVNLPRFIELQSTAGAEFDVNFDGRNNLFGTAGGPKLPVAMTQPELFELEDKVVHKIDFAALGLVRMRDNQLYVTPASFITPRTATPSIQRAVVPSAEGDQVFIQNGLYPDTARINKSLTFVPAGTRVVENNLEMIGPGRQLTLNGPFTLRRGLTLTDGKIRLNADNLIVEQTALPIIGGNSGSYVHTSAAGNLVLKGLGQGARTDSTLFPIGLENDYNPVFVRNGGVADTFAVRMLPDVFTGGLTGVSVQDSVVRASWVVTESLPGGSELRLRPQWNESQEKAQFRRNRVGIQGFFANVPGVTGPIWEPDVVLSVPVDGNNPYSAARAFPAARSFVNTPVRVISLPDLKDDVFIPSLFSPNADGNNDVLLAYSNTVQSISLKIFNRHGNLVYEANDPTQALTTGWDGTFNGQPCKPDVYVWTLTGTFQNGKPLSALGKTTGHIRLIR